MKNKLVNSKQFIEKFWKFEMLIVIPMLLTLFTLVFVLLFLSSIPTYPKQTLIILTYITGVLFILFLTIYITGLIWISKSKKLNKKKEEKREY
ncbi:hypothetical protein [Mycoplasma feriruminatoris]|uniref:Uncharacterized protein n=1 Tax=Mycoplasma feriruminatoris TaxID=1179777 RepID=A0A654IH12_9MOLU|nr:hypothetical protein [Mycoplasma feriruminatoris]WFQ92681.1 hypothetical protein MFERI14822_00470 [Mycoplasma feriruminatoris]WFQ93037.1 hypothetical protein MFERI14822_00830 [Mycoplasma feriruminatoris]WFQ93870.1 hypothetical protein MFERI15181_00791 [Mycoplasma feriruminatoris]VZR97386.1 hypothetical protein MF5295_00287 [Mycoplasma feriruminatoris]